MRDFGISAAELTWLEQSTGSQGSGLSTRQDKSITESVQDCNTQSTQWPCAFESEQSLSEH